MKAVARIFPSVFAHTEQIISLWQPPLIIKDLLNHEELEFLRHKRNEQAEISSQYGKVADVHFIDCSWKTGVGELLQPRLQAVIGEFSLSGGNFFNTRNPFTVHADTGKNTDAVPYKTIVIPIEIEPPDKRTFTILFKQRWLGVAANFYRGRTDVPQSPYNTDVFDYSDVIYLNGETPFDTRLYDQYLSHTEYSTLTGLELDQAVEWKPGSAIIFDRCQLHASDDFRRSGITLKCGLSLFTKKRI